MTGHRGCYSFKEIATFLNHWFTISRLSTVAGAWWKARVVKRTILAAALACWAAAPAVAEVFKPVTLQAIQHLDAELVVTRVDGSEIRFDPAALEALPTYQLETTTPWRTEAALFEGVRLIDLLETAGLAEVDAISVKAENEYAVTIPRQAWEDLDILVATRVNGAPIPRRERGPIQFVVDMDTYQASQSEREDFLVWMAARIAPSE